MGIVHEELGFSVEFNDKLALRPFIEYQNGKRKREECIDQLLQCSTYEFLKSDRRVFPLHENIPLVITAGEQRFSEPLALVQILEYTHAISDGKIYTRGRYKVEQLLVDLTKVE